jgi:hypothetical protein
VRPGLWQKSKMADNDTRKRKRNVAQTDSRFAHIQKDPRFKPIKNETKKVKLDSRFSEIFDEKFNTSGILHFPFHRMIPSSLRFFVFSFSNLCSRY